MKGIDKSACRKYLEPLTAPNSDCGLFLVKSLKYIVRTAIKSLGIGACWCSACTPGETPLATGRL